MEDNKQCKLQHPGSRLPQTCVQSCWDIITGQSGASTRVASVLKKPWAPSRIEDAPPAMAATTWLSKGIRDSSNRRVAVSLLWETSWMGDSICCVDEAGDERTQESRWALAAGGRTARGRASAPFRFGPGLQVLGYFRRLGAVLPQPPLLRPRAPDARRNPLTSHLPATHPHPHL
ncbi:hypothetical protein M011DRAFT_264408 [Sporormia fimetaria CBS 119925]|uniref:Uncharacterized protein n=1 Tax=Sporormia fimetaria CBS 119925 TaxID=1340428 RepID=A0A6A6UWJ8_9PLEO|nr:hypothetical protein M011DRAFT_264408 [Sporormia fimetaria CBS 119925]